MTLFDLISRYRSASGDKVAPYFWSDEEVTQWLNDAEAEAAIRGRLLHESSDPAVCSISTTAGQAQYPLHESLYEISSIAWGKDGQAHLQPLILTSTEVLDRELSNWRHLTGSPKYAVQGDKTIRLVPSPDAHGKIELEGYRLPLLPMEDVGDAPEINQAHHRHLVCWAIHVGFSIPDAELFDQRRADIARAEFEAYFGLQVDSDMRRKTRHDTPHHVEPFFI